MSKEKLEGFRVGDYKRPEVRSYGKPPASEEASASAGFPTIESRLEHGTVESVAEELRPSYEQLEALAASGDMKRRAAAKKALAAYERTADLFEYLFETKDALSR